MKKEAFRRQVITGIAGVAIVAAVDVAAYRMWGIPQNVWVRSAAMAVFAAGFFGFLFYALGGAMGFVKGGAMGLGFVGLTVAAQELPPWAFGALILAVVLAFVVRPLIRQYKRDRERDSETVIDEKAAAEVREEQVAERELEREYDEFKASVAFGERSLMLLANLTGAMVQLVRSGDRLYFLRVGGELGGLDAEKLRTDFADGAQYLRGKKDFCLRRAEIFAIQYRSGREGGTQMENCGRLTVRTASRRYVFAVLGELPAAKLQAFFSGLPFSVKAKRWADAPARALAAEEKRVLPGLKKACLALAALAVAAGAGFLFLPVGPVLYRILSALCMLVPAVTFALYVKYNALLSADDRRRDGAMFQKTGVNIVMPLTVPALVLGLRSLMDFTVTDWITLLLWAGALFAAILLMFFMLTQEYKRRKAVIVLFMIVSLFYAPAAVMQANVLYDASEPAVHAAPLLDKRISDGRRHTAYYFTVALRDGREQEVGVSKGYYGLCETGDTVIVVERSGLLGVDYVYIAETG